jgi:hypothetical protein
MTDTADTLEINPLLTEPPVTRTIELPTGHHAAVVRRALEDRTTALGKLAGKATDEGYAREGRVIAADAQILEEDVLTQLKGQLDLAFDHDELTHGIRNQLHPLVFKHVPATDDEGEVDHRKELLDALGTRVARFVTAAAERAYHAGLRARQDEPEVFAFRSLDALRPQ